MALIVQHGAADPCQCLGSLKDDLRVHRAAVSGERMREDDRRARRPGRQIEERLEGAGRSGNRSNGVSQRASSNRQRSRRRRRTAQPPGRTPRDASRCPDVPSVRWSPNGRALLAPRIENRETDRRDTELRLIPADGAAVRRIPFPSGLTRLLTSRPGAPRPSIQSVVWSPDGGRLAFALRTSQVESFMIEDPLSLTGTETHAR